MGWKLKSLVFVVAAIFVAGCAWLGYAVHARYQGNEYLVRVTAAFNAAALVNGDKTYTEPDKAVISAYDGQRYVILPENYKAIVSLLRKDHAMPLFRRVGQDAPLTIAICDSARLWIEPDEGSVDGALIAFDDSTGKHFTMHVRGGNIWKQILEYATTGHSKNQNLRL